MSGERGVWRWQGSRTDHGDRERIAKGRRALDDNGRRSQMMDPSCRSNHGQQPVSETETRRDANKIQEERRIGGRTENPPQGLLALAVGSSGQTQRAGKETTNVGHGKKGSPVEERMEIQGKTDWNSWLMRTIEYTVMAQNWFVRRNRLANAFDVSETVRLTDAEAVHAMSPAVNNPRHTSPTRSTPKTSNQDGGHA